MSSSFDLKIGFKCNNNCAHCVVADKRPSGELTLQQLYDIIDKIPEGVDTVTITGGEPSISPLLYDILKYLHEHCFKATLQTNGTGFADKELVEKIKPYIDHVLIAIHSSDPKIHDFIVQSEGMWEKTIQGFHNLLDCGVYCSTQTVLSKYNIETLWDTYDMIQKISPGIQMSMTYPHMMGNAYKNRNEVCFRYSDYKDMFQKVFRTFGKYLFLESIPPCQVFPYENVVRNTLENIILKHFKNPSWRDEEYGRIGVDFSGSLNTINYNNLDIQERRKAPRCKDCVFDNYCIGVWKEYIELFHDKLDLYPITKEKYNSEKRKVFC